MILYEEKPIIGFNNKLTNLFIRRDKLRRLLEDIDKDIAEIRAKIIKSNVVKESDKLIISEHAIDRFKERIMDVPKQKITKLLGADDLYERYTEYGPGKYRLSVDYPHVILVIKNNVIVTCYFRYDSNERLDILKNWLNQWIDERAAQLCGEEVNPIKLKTFRRNYYK